MAKAKSPDKAQRDTKFARLGAALGGGVLVKKPSTKAAEPIGASEAPEEQEPARQTPRLGVTLTPSAAEAVNVLTERLTQAMRKAPAAIRSDMQYVTSAHIARAALLYLSRGVTSALGGLVDYITEHGAAVTAAKKGELVRIHASFSDAFSADVLIPLSDAVMARRVPVGRRVGSYNTTVAVNYALIHLARAKLAEGEIIALLQSTKKA